MQSFYHLTIRQYLKRSIIFQLFFIYMDILAMAMRKVWCLGMEWKFQKVKHLNLMKMEKVI